MSGTVLQWLRAPVMSSFLGNSTAMDHMTSGNAAEAVSIEWLVCYSICQTPAMETCQKWTLTFQNRQVLRNVPTLWGIISDHFPALGTLSFFQN